jgi:hypothetical protein
VESLLSASPGKYLGREVYFLTDMQASTWVGQQPAALSGILQKIQNRARTVFVNVGGDAVPNLAITNLALDDELAGLGRLTTFTVTLQNFGFEAGRDAPRETAHVKLLIGKARTAPNDPPCTLNVVKEDLVRLERGKETNHTFAYKFPAPGEYVVQAQVDNDSLPLDDTRTIVVSVRKELPVLLVNGKPFGNTFDQSTEWLRLALNPFGDLPGTTPARPKVISAAQFADENTGDLAPPGEPYDCVYLCDVPSVGTSEARRLERHLRSGGGVVICLGGQVQPGEYNRVLYKNGTGLLPASLIGPQTATDAWDFQFALEADSEKTAPMRAFRATSDQASLRAIRFKQFFQLGETASGVKPRRVLSFAPVEIAGKEREAKAQNAPPGGPAILEWQPPNPAARKEENKGASGLSPDPRPLNPRLRGRLVLVTSTVNAEWSKWPASPSFPALMQELLYFACSGRLREQSVETAQPLELYLNTPNGGAEARVQTPDDRAETGKTENLDEGSVLRWLDTDVSGLYRVTLGAHPQEHLFAVNVPAFNDQQTSESDLKRTTKEELQQVYPEWDPQVVTDLSQVTKAALAAGEVEMVYQPLGPAIARWLLIIVLLLLFAEVVMAWIFGHYSGVAALGEQAPQTGRTWQDRTMTVLPWVLFVLVLGTAGILVHNAWTGDFLGFLPDGMRHWVERLVGVAAPAVGEESHWRLERSSNLWDGRADPWLLGALALAAIALVAAIYRREGTSNTTTGRRVILTVLRLGMFFLLLGIFLPQLQLWFDRQGWPDVVILLDDSGSMSAVDQYNDPRVQAAAEKLAALENLKEAERLKLAQLLLASPGADGRPDWLSTLVSQRKVRLHIYHCSSRAHRIKDVTTADEIPSALDAIKALRAESTNDSSQLGAAVRQVINDFRGSSLAAVVMCTDGVTTEGEDLGQVSKYAGQVGVPLFFVGIGDAHEVRDVFLSDLRAQDSVYVNDKIIFELRVNARGYDTLSLPVTLCEKGKEDEVLDRQTVQVGGSRKDVKVRLVYQPKKAGDRVFVIKVPIQPDEVDKDNNRTEHAVSVRDTKLIKVLYVEGYRRYEYHYVKSLLERESARIKGNKTMDLKVWLQAADPDHAAQDANALSKLPTKKELEVYDVVILGDVNPRPRDSLEIDEFFKNLVDFVREKGGGLLAVAGERFMPHAYKDTVLRDVLPIDLSTDRNEDPDAPIMDGYRPELTASGRVHPIFRFSADEKENDEIWSNLREFFWCAEGYQPKRLAEVLAVHPRLKRTNKMRAERADRDTPADLKHPLVTQHFVGAGRCMFFGFHETWRWGFREDLGKFNTFWIQTVRYLSRSRLGRINLTLDKQTNYQRGERIKIKASFPDDAPPPSKDIEVKVVAERRPFERPGDVQVRTIGLSWIEGSRADYEAVLTQTPEGHYAFWLSAPVVPDPKPRVECKVVAPPGEMYGLRLNQAELEQAAEATGGRFYNLADADKLLQEMPAGSRVTLSSTGPPWLLWTHTSLFLLAIVLLTTEWIMRKRENLL